MTTTVETIDLRDGYRIEVTPMIMPTGAFGATLQVRTAEPGKRQRWKDVKHPVMVADTPEDALGDLANAINLGLLPGVEVKG